MPIIHVAGDELGDGFGIRLGFKDITKRDQLLAERPVILDNAVMNESDFACHVRVGVDFVRHAVGCPTGVADPDITGQRCLIQQGLQVEQFSFGTSAVNAAVHQGRDTGRIITPVFQPLETFHQDRGHGLLTDHTDDSAHGSGLVRTSH